MMRTTRLALPLLLVSLTVPLLAQPDYYVSAEFGSDGNPGTEAAPFATLQKASNLTQPGSTVYAMNGVYAGTQVLKITRSGTPEAWITFRNYPGHKPVIRFTSWWGILIESASYIHVEGFVVDGILEDITFEEAEENKQNGSSGRHNGNGIMINQQFNDPNAPYPHHIRIVGNEIRECPGGGIAAIDADYVEITGNLVYRTSWYSGYGNSGITTYEPRNFDNRQDLYRIVIRDNVSHSNYNYFECRCSNFERVTDGNGIIIDDHRHAQDNPANAYNGRTLVANNITYNNGARGIMVYSSDNVDVVNNTSYHNLLHPDLGSGGEISVAAATNVRLFNNATTSTRVAKNLLVNPNTSKVTGDHNLMFGTLVTDLPGPNDVSGDPRFFQTPPTATFPTWEDYHLDADFRVPFDSPAVDAGSSQAAVNTDAEGLPRPQGLAYDIGAYEVPDVTPCDGGDGTLRRDWWFGVPGKPVADLRSDPRFPYRPDGSAIETFGVLEGLRDVGDDYGYRYSGYLHPPSSGTYRLYINSDDGSELWLSESASRGDLEMRASVIDYTDYGDWQKYESQISGPLELTAGKEYFLEILHKEGPGQDHLQVAWLTPGAVLSLIPGSCLSAQSTRGVRLDLKVSLGGAMGVDGEMVPALELPAEQPYASGPWNHDGGEYIISENTDDVDWVLVELHGSEVHRRAGVLHADGSVSNPDGSSPLVIPGAPAGEYRIVVRHRNHLAVQSVGVVALNP